LIEPLTLMKKGATVPEQGTNLMSEQNRLDRLEKDVQDIASSQSRLGAVVEGLAGEVKQLVSTVNQLAQAVNQHMVNAGRMDMKVVLTAVGMVAAGYWALTDRAVSPINVRLKYMERVAEKEGELRRSELQRVEDLTNVNRYQLDQMTNNRFTDKEGQALRDLIDAKIENTKGD
jgi:methyl-accepting chemotaxis protein